MSFVDVEGFNFKITKSNSETYFSHMNAKENHKSEDEYYML